MKKLMVFAAFITCVACEDDLDPPEIFIDISPIYAGTRSVDPSLEADDFDFQLTNRGEEILEIKSYKVKGDQNCSFWFEDEGPEKWKLGKNDTTFIRGWYKPTKVGDDQIVLEIYSNCHLRPTLIVPICGRGVLPEATDIGPAPECNVPPPDQPDCLTP